MYLSQFFLPTLRDAPADAVIASHALLMRSGMIRKLGNGLFTYLPLGVRSFRKIEKIIREELDACGFLECKPSVVIPGELWQESGRWQAMGQELLRVKNRLNQDLVVSPTAEEAFTALLRFELASYKQYPLTLYQINTKYRDEIRPRYGLMRAREFTMMDGYSFHTDLDSLDAVYTQFGNAYRRIFKRCGLSVVSVQADSGTMGGSGSEEFMVESVVGDDTLFLCTHCDYAANAEKATSILSPVSYNTDEKKIEKIDTPSVKTIDELTQFLHTKPEYFIKTLIYCVEGSSVVDAPVVAVCIRGDLDVNETKLCALLKAHEVALADEQTVETVTGTVVGFAGPVGLKDVPIIADHTVMLMDNAVTGALAKDTHFINVRPNRDFTPHFVADIRLVQENEFCPHCKNRLYMKKGNELGHIFKLGKKYTESMNMSYLDKDGSQGVPFMGCYGIGLDRTLASVAEEHHDDKGLCWPVSIAPFHVGIVPIKYSNETKRLTDELAQLLEKRGIEVLIDDREERPGVKFNDMDLIGLPIRLVISEKKLPQIECKLRTASEVHLLNQDETIAFIEGFIKKEIEG